VRADADLYPKLPQPAVTDLVLAGAQVQALVYAGELDRASAVAAPMAAAPIDRELSLFQRFAEGLATLRLAQGDHEGALELARGMEAWEAGTGLRNGTWVAWRSQAAVAHAALGDRDRALSLAGEQVALARRFGAPGMLGSALRVLGVVRGGEDGIGELREASEALERSALRLEHARALIDLGAAQRRDGQQAESRERLREGLDLAHRCGASALANAALDELVAAGGRPRQPTASDTDTLTPSERRVSEMAAGGMTNKEIAQGLFVTVKTVETHLGHAYGKLGINSRSQLASRLASEAQ
jgi:DNA-binding CsgD family transcriptional regulator